MTELLLIPALALLGAGPEMIETLIQVVLMVAGGYLLTLITWLFFIAIMHLRMVRHSLHPFAKFNAYILVVVGLVLDFLLNVTVGTVLFHEPPKEWLLTDRLKRLKREGNAYQRAVAYWICEHLLDQFDFGHC